VLLVLFGDEIIYMMHFSINIFKKER